MSGWGTLAQVGYNTDIEPLRISLMGGSVASLRRAGTTLAVLAFVAPGVAGQDNDAVRQAYFSAVAEFFGVSRSEVSILGDWRLPTDEIPVVLFLARRAGVSAEALAALRRSGSAWSQLMTRYGVDAGALHLPLPDAAQAGRLQTAYEHYRGLPPARWAEVRLTDQDVVALVNVRILAQTFALSVEEILRRAGPTGTFLELYPRLIRDGEPLD
jgi:hypothetical protein